MAGELKISPPRDRNGTFEPVIVEKRKKEIKGGLEDLILSLYAKGSSVEDIHRLLHEIYGVEYSTSAISMITERVLPEILEWQRRPLDPCYAILYLDGIHFRVKQDGQFIGKCVYSVYAINAEGERDVLGIYLSNNESSNEWGVILEDLVERGVKDVFIVCIDGLKGFKSTIEKVFPDAMVQRCVIHKIRNSVRFVPDKNKRAVCADLKKVYGSKNRKEAEMALASFRVTWGALGERIAKKWEEDWEELTAYMEFDQSIKKMIYTTNPVENLHRIIRKVTKSKGAWISEKALIKQIYLTLMYNHKRPK